MFDPDSGGDESDNDGTGGTGVNLQKKVIQMQETNEIRRACKILDIQIMNDQGDENEIATPVKIRSPSNDTTFETEEAFTKYLAECLKPNVEFWDNNEPHDLQNLEEALDLIHALDSDTYYDLHVGYLSIRASSGGSSGYRFEWAVSKSQVNDEIVDALEASGDAAWESCDDDNILLTLETDCVDNFDDIKNYYQKVIAAGLK